MFISDANILVEWLKFISSTCKYIIFAYNQAWIDSVSRQEKIAIKFGFG
jgi:hypothetical protein